jgi:phage terminase small subunit
MEIIQRKTTDLTTKQKAFCEFYAGNGGNATQAAIDAGYSENTAKEIGSENLTKPHILEYIRELSAPAENKRIASTTEIKEFWSSILRDDMEKTTDRLKASELLGKSAAMFIDRVEIKETSTSDELRNLIGRLPENAK